MVSATLVNHCGARQVNAAELATIQPPAPTRTWYPLPHRTVLDSVCTTLNGAGFAIVRSRLSVSHGGARFFGTLDLATSISDGVSLAVGIRNSNDQSLRPTPFFNHQRQQPQADDATFVGLQQQRVGRVVAEFQALHSLDPGGG